MSLICHITVMKNVAPCLLAFVLVSPVAMADSAKNQPAPFEISVKSALTPVAHAEFRYPYSAARQGLDGTCDVSFSVDAAGRPRSVTILSCSSEAFRSAAKSVVEGLKFSRTGASIQSVTATIRWDINARQYASLD